MSAKKSKTFFKTLTAILVLLLFFGGYYIYSSGIFGASVTENISEHSITDEERLIEYEEYGITYDESSQSYLYQDSLIKNLRDGDFLYTNAAGSIKLIIQRDDNGHIQSIDVESFCHPFENLTNFRFFSMLFYFYKIHDFRFLGDHSIIPHQAKKPSPKLKMIQLYSVGKIQYCYRSKIAVEINYSRVGFS